jgi:hypothetical protein
MKSRLIRFFIQSKNYALAVGIICFAIGMFGFIFKSSNSISSPVLLLLIIFGVWGVLVGVREKI